MFPPPHLGGGNWVSEGSGFEELRRFEEVLKKKNFWKSLFLADFGKKIFDFLDPGTLSIWPGRGPKIEKKFDQNRSKNRLFQKKIF